MRGRLTIVKEIGEGTKDSRMVYGKELNSSLQFLVEDYCVYKIYDIRSARI